MKWQKLVKFVIQVKKLVKFVIQVNTMKYIKTIYKLMLFKLYKDQQTKRLLKTVKNNYDKL